MTFRRCFFPLVLAGCAQQQASEPAAEPVSVGVAPLSASAPAAEPKPAPAPQPPPPPAPPPEFTFPADLTGKALARVVAPDMARPLPTERFGTAPQPWVVPARVLAPVALAPADYDLPPLLLPRPTTPSPAAPPEAVPVDLGEGVLPAKVRLPVTAVVTARARDVNLPPPAPSLGRPLATRVSVDDPTGELGNAEIVAGAAAVPLAASGFLRVTIPDPFELAGQVKPDVPPAAEPSAAPVPVNPLRIK